MEVRSHSSYLTLEEASIGVGGLVKSDMEEQDSLRSQPQFCIIRTGQIKKRFMCELDAWCLEHRYQCSAIARRGFIPTM